jgi:hypothetical protein
LVLGGGRVGKSKNNPRKRIKGTEEKRMREDKHIGDGTY